MTGAESDYGSAAIVLEQLACGLQATAGLLAPPLSIQQMNECDGLSPAGGHLFGTALKYVVANGLETEKCYPTTPAAGKCSYSERLVAVRATGIGGTLGSAAAANETALALALREAPVLVALSIGREFELFTGGAVLKRCAANGTAQGLHNVEIVGHGVTAAGEAYWSVKNSWGEGWGDRGYAKLAKDAGNACDVATNWAYPTGLSYEEVNC